MNLVSTRRRTLALTALACATVLTGAAHAAPAKAYMSIIIDDLGQSPERDGRTLALPGPVTMAIMPDTPHATEFAREAHRAGSQDNTSSARAAHLPAHSQCWPRCTPR